MFECIYWQARVRATDDEQVRECLEAISSALGCPLECDSMGLIDAEHGFANLKTPLYFDNPWEGIHHAFEAMVRLATEWNLQGPHERWDGMLSLSGDAASGSIKVDGLAGLSFIAAHRDEAPPEDRLGADAAVELDDPQESARLDEARRRALPHLLRIEAEFAELLDEREDPFEDPDAILEDLMSGYDLAAQSEGCHGAMRLVALERMIAWTRAGDSRQVAISAWALRLSNGRPVAASWFDASILCALAGVTIREEMEIVDDALELTLPIAVESMRSLGLHMGSLPAATDLLSSLEGRLDLYQRHEEGVRRLRSAARHVGQPQGLAPSPFAATDPWGVAMRDVDLGDALKLVHFLASGRPTAGRNRKWRKRCGVLLAHSSDAARVLQVMMTTLVMRGRDGEAPVWLPFGAASDRQENAVLVKYAVWALGELKAPWVEEVVGDVALSMEEWSDAITMAAMAVLGEIDPRGQGAVVARVRDEARGQHLRMAAERLIEQGGVTG